MGLVAELGVGAYEEAVKVMNAKHSMCGVPIPVDSQAAEVSRQYLRTAYLDGTFGYKAFGLFKEHEGLVSMLLLHVSRQQPCYFITRLFSLDPKNFAETRELFHEVIKRMEHTTNLDRFYTAYPPDWSPLYSRWMKLHNYTATTELVVPKHTRPVYSEFFNVLMARQLWPVDMVVRRFIKKEAACHSLDS